MRMTPTPTASVAKRVQAHRDWRPLTTGEAVVAIVVDVLPAKIGRASCRERV